MTRPRVHGLGRPISSRRTTGGFVPSAAALRGERGGR
jgi:hypothetical protein